MKTIAFGMFDIVQGAALELVRGVQPLPIEQNAHVTPDGFVIDTFKAAPEWPLGTTGVLAMASACVSVLK